MTLALALFTLGTPIYAQCNHNLFDTIAKIVDEKLVDFAPLFIADSDESILIWNAIKELSDELIKANVVLNLQDARTFVADVISGVSIRAPIKEDAKIVVLGTIESRMQTADVVILTGLNEGMFPSRGYENAWLPRKIADKVGLPSADRKVSLQSLPPTSFSQFVRGYLLLKSLQVLRDLL